MRVLMFLLCWVGWRFMAFLSGDLGGGEVKRLGGGEFEKFVGGGGRGFKRFVEKGFKRFVEGGGGSLKGLGDSWEVLGVSRRV